MAGFTVAQPGGYSADLDALLVRRDLFNSGNLWGCGDGGGGVLGNGNTTNQYSFVQVSGAGLTWRSVSAGYNHTAAIKTDGTLWSWGSSGEGRLGDGTTTKRSSPGTTAGGGTTWRSVACGYAITSAIKTDGTLWTWGGNTAGALGNNNTVNRSSPDTVAGGGTTWQMVACNNNIDGAIAAIKTDGTLWTWGWNPKGLLGTGSTANRSSPGTVAGGGTTWGLIACGYGWAAAVKTDGTLWTWGDGLLGTLGNGSTANTSSPGTVAGGGTTWSSVACASNGRHTAAIKTDGTLWTWGDNSTGALGDGTSTNRSSPGTVAGGGTTWKSVSCGGAHTAAIKTDGTLWTWGLSNYGQLGTGAVTSTTSPGTVSGGGTNWKSVSAGASSTMAITDLTT